MPTSRAAHRSDAGRADTLHGVMHLARESDASSGRKRAARDLRPTLLYGAADPHNGYGPNRFRRLATRRRHHAVRRGRGAARSCDIDDVAEIVRAACSRTARRRAQCRDRHRHSLPRDRRDGGRTSPRKVAIRDRRAAARCRTTAIGRSTPRRPQRPSRISAIPPSSRPRRGRNGRNSTDALKSIFCARCPAKRNIPKRADAKTPKSSPSPRNTANSIRRPREYGYGGYRYDGRWQPVARDIVAHLA